MFKAFHSNCILEIKLYKNILYLANQTYRFFFKMGQTRPHLFIFVSFT